MLLHFASDVLTDFCRIVWVFRFWCSRQSVVSASKEELQGKREVKRRKKLHISQCYCNMNRAKQNTRYHSVHAILHPSLNKINVFSPYSWDACKLHSVHPLSQGVCLWPVSWSILVQIQWSKMHRLHHIITLAPQLQSFTAGWYLHALALSSHTLNWTVNHVRQSDVHRSIAVGNRRRLLVPFCICTPPVLNLTRGGVSAVP